MNLQEWERQYAMVQTEVARLELHSRSDAAS